MGVAAAARNLPLEYIYPATETTLESVGATSTRENPLKVTEIARSSIIKSQTCQDIVGDETW